MNEKRYKVQVVTETEEGLVIRITDTKLKRLKVLWQSKSGSLEELWSHYSHEPEEFDE